MTTTGPAEQGIESIWPGTKPLIGMVHLLPLPGAPGWRGSMAEVTDRALADAEALIQAGLDGLMVENYGDVPFFGGTVPPETVAAMATVVSRVVAGGRLPVGVNVLRNDAAAALGVAAATGARFIRVNVHTGVMWTDQGVVEGRAAETLRTRETLAAPVAIFADVHVKHATPPPGLSVEDAAADAWHRGLADALVVSGAATGSPTDPDLAVRVSAAVPSARVILGSGVTHETVADLLGLCDGAIVGSALTLDGKAGTGIHPETARRFVEAARKES